MSIVSCGFISYWQIGSHEETRPDGNPSFQTVLILTKYHGHNRECFQLDDNTRDSDGLPLKPIMAYTWYYPADLEPESQQAEA